MTKFTLDLLPLPDMPTVEVNGKRFYVTPESNHYPSVTTVLAQFGDKSGIERWKQRIGEEEAGKILVKASRRGTGVHLLCEQFLLGQQIDLSSKLPNQVALFKQLVPVLENNVEVVRGLECALYSDKLKIAGRCDAIVRYNGVESILDFKTSSSVKQVDYIENYFLQATLYSCMVYEMTGFKAQQIVIAIAVESENYPQMFIRPVEKYIDKAIMATRTYYQNGIDLQHQ